MYHKSHSLPPPNTKVPRCVIFYSLLFLCVFKIWILSSARRCQMTLMIRIELPTRFTACTFCIMCNQCSSEISEEHAASIFKKEIFYQWWYKDFERDLSVCFSGLSVWRPTSFWRAFLRSGARRTRRHSATYLAQKWISRKSYLRTCLRRRKILSAACSCETQGEFSAQRF